MHRMVNDPIQNLFQVLYLSTIAIKKIIITLDCMHVASLLKSLLIQLLQCSNEPL